MEKTARKENLKKLHEYLSNPVNFVQVYPVINDDPKLKAPWDAFKKTVADRYQEIAADSVPSTGSLPNVR